jgi:D-apionolactonase
LPPTVDSRQGSLFAAAWTVAHLAQIATATHLHSATYFETVGWRGVMESDAGSPLPEKFFSIPGAVFPAYHVFADVAGFNRVCPTHPTLPLEVAGLTLLDAQNRRRILVANLQPHTQELKIKTGSCSGRLRRLNASNAEEAMRAPEAFRAAAGEPVQAAGGKVEVRLEPYEIIRLDVV